MKQEPKKVFKILFEYNFETNEVKESTEILCTRKDAINLLAKNSNFALQLLQEFTEIQKEQILNP